MWLGSRRRKAFVHYLITNIVLTVTAIGLSVVAFAFTIASLRESSTRTWTNSFSASVSLVESRISDSIALTERVVNSTPVRALTFSEHPLPAPRYIQLRQASDYINASGAELGIAEDLVLYLDRPGVVVSRDLADPDWRRYFTSFFTIDGLELIDVKERLAGTRHAPEIWPVARVSTSRFSGEAMVIARAFPPQNQSYRGVALLVIPARRVYEYLVPLERSADVSLDIVNPEGVVLYTSHPPRTADRMITITHTSQASSLRYRLRIPGRVVWGDLRLLRYLLAGTIVAMLVTGVALSVLFARRNSRPLQLLARRLAGDPAPDAQFRLEEMAAIDHGARRLVSRASELDLELQRQRPLVHAALLSRLFSGAFHDEFDAQNELAAVELELGPPPYCVVVIQSLTDRVPVGGEESDILRAVFLRVLQEELEREVPYLADPQSRAVLVIGGYDAARDLESLDVARETLQDELRIMIGIGLGVQVEGVVELSRSYETAEQVAEYVRFFRDGRVLTYASASGSQRRFTYPLETEVELIRHLRHGDVAAVARVARGLIDNAVSPEPGRIHDIKRFYADLSGVARRAARQFMTEGLESTATVLRRVMSLPSASIERSHFELLYGLLIEVAETVRSQSSQRARLIYESALAIIEREYSDPQINLAFVAQSVGLSESYLSTLFKSVSGDGYYEHLERVRMDAAERALLESDEPINAVARACGYTNVNTFFKAFKRVHGVTPVQYRRASRRHASTA